MHCRAVAHPSLVCDVSLPVLGSIFGEYVRLCGLAMAAKFACNRLHTRPTAWVASRAQTLYLAAMATLFVTRISLCPHDQKHDFLGYGMHETYPVCQSLWQRAVAHGACQRLRTPGQSLRFASRPHHSQSCIAHDQEHDEFA